MLASQRRAARHPTVTVAPAAEGHAFLRPGGAVDYLSVDRLVVPPHAAAPLAERLALLPHTYQVPPELFGVQTFAAAAPPRASLSVGARGPLLGCFVRASRLHPHSLSQWLDTLRRCGWWHAPSTPCEDTAPSASLDHLKAQAAPARPGARRKQLGGLP